jgi:hypothetical protein
LEIILLSLSWVGLALDVQERLRRVCKGSTQQAERWIKIATREKFRRKKKIKGIFFSAINSNLKSDLRKRCSGSDVRPCGNEPSAKERHFFNSVKEGHL